MRKLIYLLCVPMMVAIVACSGKNGAAQSDAQVLMQDSTDAHGLQRMQVSRSETDIQFKGKEYHCLISRTPDDSLPNVVSETGDTYVDNRIVFHLNRGNERVFSKTFTKSSFASLVDDRFLTKSILEGIVYNKNVPEGMVFAASVCYPQTDLYVPISITISSDGKMTMKKEELLEEVYETDTL